MGSTAILKIDNLEIAYSKNYILNFSLLFSESDKFLANKYYEINDDEDLEYYNDNYFIYVRKLNRLNQRFELLGYTKEIISSKYEEYICDFNDENEINVNWLNLDFLLKYLLSLDLKKIEFISDLHVFGESALSRNFIIYLKNNYVEIYNENEDNLYYLANFLDSLNPYFLLSIFVFYEISPESSLVWDYFFVLDNGWHDEGGYSDVSKNPLFLLITEGSSDSLIIKNALDWIYPDINGFFEFIDMEANYPFTGVGHIVNFYHGICKLGINRNIIFIFDNDTAGNDALLRCIDPPENISLIKLPDLKLFENFNTVGPNGNSTIDINGKAVSIECFLDLKYRISDEPTIRWISYFEKVDRYQGSLINKEKYSKLFLNARKINDLNYSKDKLIKLLDHIIKTASILNKENNYDA